MLLTNYILLLWEEEFCACIISHYFNTQSLFIQNKRGNQAPFQSRIQMCQLLFKDIPNVIVSEAERLCFEKVSDAL